MEAKVRLMINLTWTKTKKFSKASPQCAQYSPSKQNPEKGKATNLAVTEILTLRYQEPKCEITSISLS